MTHPPENPTVLDEMSRRKPTFVDGVSIELGGGQSWTFPRPVVIFAPPTKFRRDFEAGDDGAWSMGRPVAIDGDPYFARVEAVRRNEAQVSLEAAFGLCADLLMFNYDLTPAEMTSLLPYVHDDEGNQEEGNRDLWMSILDVALGNDLPKPSPAG